MNRKIFTSVMSFSVLVVSFLIILSNLISLRQESSLFSEISPLLSLGLSASAFISIIGSYLVYKGNMVVILLFLFLSTIFTMLGFYDYRQIPVEMITNPIAFSDEFIKFYGVSTMIHVFSIIILITGGWLAINIRPIKTS